MGAMSSDLIALSQVTHSTFGQRVGATPQADRWRFGPPPEAGDNGLVTEPLPGRPIPDPGFAGDDGAPSHRLAIALAAWDAGRAPYSEVLLALEGARVLVPVVAVLGDVEHDADGLAREKSSDMATVLLQGADGRLALLAFTGTPALRQWDPTARPVPVTARLAAEAALQDGAAALVLDVAGPVRLVVEGPDLEGLAGGWTLARVGDGTAWIRPDGESSATIER